MSNIKKIDISKVMKIKYMDYAISVIVGRALPDVRDGLKWVHRRSIYSMYQLGLMPDKGYRKSARIVGDVLGKYHPHGDTAVYDAMVRMAQKFSINYPLIDGHGNWGSIDGDNPAHYRYTEAKLMKITLELLKDINKNTVDFIPNFDGEEKEPTVLPSRFPNLLVNGSEGIAVGVATKIPPHNLSDTINTVIHQIDNPNCSIKDLVDILKAPDFPTGGEIINPQNMIDIYTKGFGKITIRAKYHIEINPDNQKSNSIIITEIPYQLNKSKLLEQLFELCNTTKKTIIRKNGKKEEIIIKPKIEGVSNITDESDRKGMRINIKLKNNVDYNTILPLLFKFSKLQDNYSANFTAIYGINQLLEHLNLKEIINFYIEHQKQVLTRKTQFNLDKAKKRLYILKGFKNAISNLDKTIELIKTSTSTQEAKEKLMTYLSIDEIQSKSILDLKLQRLTGLEIEGIEKEFNELIKKVESLRFILNNEKQLLQLLKTDLNEIKDKYGNIRKTKLIYKNDIQEISTEDLVEDFNPTLILTKQGYIKKNRKYSDSQKLKDNDEILQTQQCNNKDDLLLFTNQGNMFIRKVYELDEHKPSQLGEYLPNLLKGYLQPNEQVIYITTTKNYTGNMLFAFKNGNVSKIPLIQYKPKQNRLTTIKAYNTDSPLMGIIHSNSDIDILFITSEGMGLIINTNKINTKKSRTSQGAKAINLKSDKFENNEMVKCIMNCNLDTNITLQTEKDKSIEIMLNDVCPINENKSIYNHIKKSKGSKGNMIYNCRQKKDRITGVKLGLIEN